MDPTSTKPLPLAGVEILGFVLEDETRVLSHGGLLRAIGRSRTPKAGAGGVDKTPTFLAGGVDKPDPVSAGGRRAGQLRLLRALPLVCKVYLDAREANVLHP